MAVSKKEGHIIVSDCQNHRVQVFTCSGDFLHSFGSFGSADGQFQLPCGVAVDNKEGHIIVADDHSNRVQVFTGQGAFVHSFCVEQPTCLRTFGSLLFYGIAVDREDNIIVANNNCIKVF